VHQLTRPDHGEIRLLRRENRGVVLEHPPGIGGACLGVSGTALRAAPAAGEQVE